MSLATFQSSLARLATETRFRELVHADGGLALQDLDLTEGERTRIAQLSSHPGMAVTARLISSFRLGKLLTLVPLTRVLLGDLRLTREARSFWAKHPPNSFHAVEEALQFCAHLLRRRPRFSIYAGEVVRFERALLELNRVRPHGEPAEAQVVRFSHDARELLTALTQGRVPTRVPRRPCRVLATRRADGQIDWVRLPDAGAARGTQNTTDVHARTLQERTSPFAT